MRVQVYVPQNSMAPQNTNSSIDFEKLHKIKNQWLFGVTADVRQPWTNHVNNGNKYLINGAVISSEYSNI